MPYGTEGWDNFGFGRGGGGWVHRICRYCKGPSVPDTLSSTALEHWTPCSTAHGRSSVGCANRGSSNSKYMPERKLGVTVTIYCILELQTRQFVPSRLPQSNNVACQAIRHGGYISLLIQNPQNKFWASEATFGRSQMVMIKWKLLFVSGCEYNSPSCLFGTCVTLCQEDTSGDTALQ